MSSHPLLPRRYSLRRATHILMLIATLLTLVQASLTAAQPAAAQSAPQVGGQWSLPIDVSVDIYSRSPAVAMNAGHAVTIFSTGAPSDLHIIRGASSTDNGHSFSPLAHALHWCSGNGSNGTNVQVAIDQMGYTYAIWPEDCSGNDIYHLWYGRINPSGEADVHCELSSERSKGGGIAVGSDGTVHVAYIAHTDPILADPFAQPNDSHGPIKYLRASDRATSCASFTSTTMDNSSRNTKYIGVVVDTANRPHLVYDRRSDGEINSEIIARDYLNGTWQAAVSLANGDRYIAPAAAADALGGVGAVWQRNFVNITNIQQINYAAWNPSTQQWDSSYTAVGDAGHANYPTLAYDQQGIAYACWSERIESIWQLLCANQSAPHSAFDPPTLVEGSGAVGNPALASGNNNLLLLYDYHPGTADWHVYARYLQLATPGPTNTPTQPATSTPTNTPIPTHTPCPTQSYTDICLNHWANAAIERLNQLNIMGGYTVQQCLTARATAPCFLPTHNVTRAEMVKVLKRMEGWTITTPNGGSQHFTDVPPSYFAYIYIETAYGLGVVHGKSAAQCAAANASFPCFLPNQSLTRAEIVSMIAAAHHLALYTPTTPDFDDVQPSHYAYLPIESAYNQRIVRGTRPRTFSPEALISRAEVAVIISNTIGLATPNPTP